MAAHRNDVYQRREELTQHSLESQISSSQPQLANL